MSQQNKKTPNNFKKIKNTSNKTNNSFTSKSQLSNNLSVSNNKNEVNNNENNNINNNSVNLSPIKTEIIDERSEYHRNKMSLSIKNINYKFILIYGNKDYFLSLKPSTKIGEMKSEISKIICLDVKKITMIYNDKEITDMSSNAPINSFFNFRKLKSRPIIYIKKKFINNSKNIQNLSECYGNKNYKNKIRILNYPTMSSSGASSDDDIFNIITNFCKDNSINSDFTCEKEGSVNSGNYIVTFPTPNIAFDFKRYLTMLKITKELFKDIKVSVSFAKKNNLFLNQSINSVNDVDNSRKSNISFNSNNKKGNNSKNNNIINNSAYVKIMNK